MTKVDRISYTLTIEDVELTTGTIYFKVFQDHSKDTNWGFDPNDATYNLQGVRLDKLQKGLNIVDGKKIYVK